MSWNKLVEVGCVTKASLHGYYVVTTLEATSCLTTLSWAKNPRVEGGSRYRRCSTHVATASRDRCSIVRTQGGRSNTSSYSKEAPYAQTTFFWKSGPDEVAGYVRRGIYVCTFRTPFRVSLREQLHPPF